MLEGPVSFDAINDCTGFAQGELFECEEEVRDYFNVENLEMIFREECEWGQEDLDEMADRVVKNGWHMEKKVGDG